MEGDADERAEVAAAPDDAGVTAATAAPSPPPSAAPAATTQTNIAADGVVALPAPAAAPARSHPNEADPPTAKDVPERVGEHQQQNGETEKATTKTDADDADAADAPPPQPPLDDEALLASFFAEVKSADRDAEVNRILGAFKLNPYEKLGVRFDADAGEVARAYRKSSLLVHPDKCSHPRAADAFDLLGAAAASLRDGAEGLDELRFVLDSAREQLRAERKKEAKKDGAARLAALVVGGGAQGVQAAWERSEAFHERWRALSRESLARNEFKRRKLTLRLKETEERLAGEAKAERKKAKTERKSEKAWEKSREGRVGAWRDFAKKGGGGGGVTAAGGAQKKGKAGASMPLKGLPSSWSGGVGASSGAAAAAAPGSADPNGAAAASARDPERSYVRRPAPGGEGF